MSKLDSKYKYIIFNKQLKTSFFIICVALISKVNASDQDEIKTGAEINNKKIIVKSDFEKILEQYLPDVLTNIVKDYADSWDCVSPVSIQDDKCNSDIKSLSPGISSLAVSPDNNILAISSINEIRIFKKNKNTNSFAFFEDNIEIKDKIKVTKFNDIEAITFINNSQLAVVCQNNQNIRIYELNTKQLITVIQTNKYKPYYNGKCLAMLLMTTI